MRAAGVGDLGEEKGGTLCPRHTPARIIILTSLSSSPTSGTDALKLPLALDALKPPLAGRVFLFQFAPEDGEHGALPGASARVPVHIIVDSDRSCSLVAAVLGAAALGANTPRKERVV